MSGSTEPAPMSSADKLNKVAFLIQISMPGAPTQSRAGIAQP
jgi:hypothetical protein